MGIHPRYFGIDQRLKHGGTISHYVEMYHPDKSFLGHTQVIKVGDLGKVSAIESMHRRSVCGMLCLLSAGVSGAPVAFLGPHRSCMVGEHVLAHGSEKGGATVFLSVGICLLNIALALCSMAT